MFTTIKHLVELMDKNIAYVLDAKDHHSCSEDEYNDYLENMEYLLDMQVRKLSQISGNTKLVESYKKKVLELF